MRSLQALDRVSTFSASSHTRSMVKSHLVQGSTTSPSAVARSCSICTQLHLTFKCPDYTSKSRQQKINLIREKLLCFNCLGLHRVNVCPNLRRCLKCGKKHHTLIHGDGETTTSHFSPSRPTSHAQSNLSLDQAEHKSTSSS